MLERLVGPITEVAGRDGGDSGNGGVHPSPEEPLLEEDLLVEEISIDGMCGVY